MAPSGFSQNWIHSSRGLEGSFTTKERHSSDHDDSRNLEPRLHQTSSFGDSKEMYSHPSQQTNELHDPSNFLGQAPQKGSLGPDHGENESATEDSGFSLPKDHPKMKTMFPQDHDGLCKIDQEQVSNHAGESVSNSAPMSNSARRDSDASTRSLVDEPMDEPMDTTKPMPASFPHEFDHTTPYGTATENKRTLEPKSDRRRSLTQSIGKLFGRGPKPD